MLVLMSNFAIAPDVTVMSIAEGEGSVCLISTLREPFLVKN
jgi:hypothetical protein